MAENYASFLGSAFSRGDDTMKFAAVKGALQSYLEAHPNQKLSTLLNAAIDLSQVHTPNDLKVTIETSDKCLLLGGYEGCPMVVTVEPQTNGMYTLKIYNQEPESNQPSELTSTMDAARGYFEIPDVSSDTLFKTSGFMSGVQNFFAQSGAVEKSKPTVLEALIALRAAGVENPDEYFKVNVLDQLGMPEQSAGHIHHLLRPEMPGTTASRSLLAALSSSMPQEQDAKAFRSQFDLHVLKNFENDLTKLVRKDITKENYPATRSLANTVMSAFIEASARLRGVEGADSVLALHADLLDRLEQKLIACQRQLYTGEFSTKISVAGPLSLEPSQWKTAPADATTAEADEFQPDPMSKQEQQVLNAIKNQPAEVALQQLAKLDATTGAYFYITDCFFKKVGSIKALGEMPFENPQEAMKSLQEVISNLSEKINAHNANGTNSELYGAFLAACYMFEQAFQKLAHEQAVVSHKVFSNLATGTVYQHVAALRTSDPFWASCFKEILQLREGLSGENKVLADSFITASFEKQEMQLGNGLAEGIKSWIRHPDFAMAKMVRESIAVDRKNQDALIALQVKEEIDKVTSYEKEKARLEQAKAPLEEELAAVKSRGETLEKEILELGGQISTLGKVKAGAKGLATKIGQKLVGTEKRETRAQAKDREALEAKRNEKIDALNEALTKGNEEIRRLEAEIAVLDQQIEEQVTFIAHAVQGINGGNRQAIGDSSSWQLGGITRNVRTDPDFWPWGVGEADRAPEKWADAWAPWGQKPQGHALPHASAPWKPQEVAAFFLANQPQLFQKKLNGVSDPLPAEFRAYSEMSILARNIFYKTDGAMPSTIPIGINDAMQLIIGDLSDASFDEKVQRPDFYSDELVDEDRWRVYSHIYSVPYQEGATHLQELHIPNVVGQGIARALPNDNKAPSMLRRAGGAAVAVAGGVWSGAKAVYQKGLVGAVKAGWKAVRGRNIPLKDEIRDLCQLHCAKGMQIDSTISYFQENPKKLFESDSRLLFHALLFESDLLLEAFQNERTQGLVADRLRSLFHDVIDSAARLKDDKDLSAEAIETYADVIWIAANIQNYLNRFPLPEKTPPILSAEDLCGFIKTFAEHKYEEQLPVVFEAAVAASGLLFSGKTETAEEQKLFTYGLLARVLKDRYPLNEESRLSAARRSDAAKAAPKMKEHLAAVDPKVMAQSLDKVAPELLGSMFSVFANATFEAGNDGVFKTAGGKTILSLTDATISSTDPDFARQYTNSVPSRIAELLCQQKLFKDVVACSALRCYMEGSTCCIFDKEHDLYFKVIGNDVFVSAEVKDEWHHHLYPKVEFKNHELLEQYHQWADPDKKRVYLVDKNTLEPVFETDKDQKITKIPIPIRAFKKLFRVDPRDVQDFSDQLKVIKENCEKSEHVDKEKYVNALFAVLQFTIDPQVRITANALLDSLKIDKTKGDKHFITRELGVPSKDSMLNAFEYAGTTFYWMNKQLEIQEIEFSRLGITLERHNGSFSPKGMKGWVVSKEQFVPQLEQEGGFLVLENPVTKDKKVLFPLWDLKNDGTYNFRPKDEFGRMVEVSLVKDALVPTTLEARYFLANLFLAKGNIDQAEGLLYSIEAQVTSRKLATRADFDVRAEKLSGSSYEKAFRDECRQELELLKTIAEPSGAERLTAREIKLKMHALYLMKQNEEQFPKEALKEDPRKKIEPPSVDDLAKELNFAELYLSAVAEKNPLAPSAELLVLENIVNAYRNQRYLEAKNPQIEIFEQDPTVRLQERMRVLKEQTSAEKLQEAVVPKAQVAVSPSVIVYKELFTFDPRDASDDQFIKDLDTIEQKCKALDLPTVDKQKYVSALCAVLEFTQEPAVRQKAIGILNTLELSKHFGKTLIQPSIVYASSRQSGGFPFNPRNVDLKEFSRYAPYIVQEAITVTSKRAAESSGLLEALTTIKQCHGNDEVGTAVGSLLARLEENMGREDINKTLYPLAAMKTMVEDRGVTKKLRDTYFIQEQRVRPEVERKELLPANSPEVGTEEVTKQKFKEASEDIKVAQVKLPGGGIYTWVDKKDPSSLKDALKTELEKELKLFAHQETLIVNTLAQALSTDSAKATAYATRSLFYPTIEEIGFMCARKDYDAYAAKQYPELTQEGRNNLQQAVKKYFFQKEAVQQLNRSIGAVDKLIGDEAKLQKAISTLSEAAGVGDLKRKQAEDAVGQLKELKKSSQNALALQLGLTRAYPPDHPNAMIFLFLETALDIKLRSDQVQNILQFANGIVSAKSLVLQMIMGAGKTAVIQPFLAILLANPGALSTVMVPESLFPTVRDSLAVILGKAADQMLVSLPYDIELSQDSEYLDTVLKRLVETQEKGGTLIISPRQKHSMLTSLYEAFYSLSDPSIKRNRIIEVEAQLEQAEETEVKDQEILSANKEVYRIRLEKAEGNEQKTQEVLQAKEAFEQRHADRAAKRKEKVEKLEAKLAELQGDGYDSKLKERTEKICSVCDFLQKHESVQIDEIDMVMNPNIVFKRPIGMAQVFDAHEDKSQAFVRSIFLTDLLLDLAEDADLNDEVSIDFVNAMRRNPGDPIVRRGVEINEQLYTDKVQPKLVEKALARLQQHSAFRELLKNPESSKKIERFIIQKEVSEADKKWIEGAITDETAQKLLGSVAHVITNVLPTSLLKECKANYGKDPLLDVENPAKRKYVARPYSAPDAPKPTMYADPHEKIIYSVQYYLYNGIPLKDAEELLIKWQASAKKEMSDSVGLKLDQTEKYGDFTRVMNLPGLTKGLSFLTDPRSKDFPAVVEAFQKAISKDRKSILEFCKGHLFEQNTVYNQNVTSTPQTLVGSSQQSLGYTGTMHAAILAPSMQAIAEKGTDGTTIAAMDRAFVSGAATVTSLTKEQKPAEEVIQQFMDPEYYVCIDSGNWLKEEKLENFAQRLLQECEKDGKRADIEGVVYHDADNNLVCLQKNEDRSLSVVPFEFSRLKDSPEKRLTIIRSKNETGTNIPQKATAKAMMTVRKDMTLRDVLQSAFRMRKILEGQSVSYKMSVEVKSHMAQSILKSLLSSVSAAGFTAGKQINKDAFFKEIEGVELTEELNKNLADAIDLYNKHETPSLLVLHECFSETFVPDSQSCLRYFAANLAKVELDKNWAAARYKMRDAFEKPLRAIFTDNTVSLEDRLKLFNHPEVKKVLVQEEKDSRFQELLAGQKKIDREIAVQNEKERYTKALSALMNDVSLPEQLRLQLAALIVPEAASKPQALDQAKKVSLEALRGALDKCVNLKDLPTKIRGVDPAQENEVEAEREAEVEKEAELEAEVELEDEQEAEEEKQLELEGVKAPAIKAYEELVAPLDGSKNSYNVNLLFEKRDFDMLGAVLPRGLTLPARDKIEYSQNFIPDTLQLDQPEHAKNHLSARYMLALNEGGNTRYILVSNVDADKIKEGLAKGKLSQGRQALLCDLNGNVIERSQVKAADLINNDEARSLLLQARFISAKPILKSAEVKELAKLIAIDESDTNREICRKYYENCLNYLESAGKVYKGSVLEKMLNGEYQPD